MRKVAASCLLLTIGVLLPVCAASAAAPLVSAAVPIAASAAVTIDNAPTVTVEDRSWQPDQDRIEATLSGWSAGQVVTLSVCGQLAERGSADCVTTASSTATTDTNGNGTGTVAATVPEVGCPCVVRATTLDSATTAIAPITLTGVPDTPRVDEPEPVTEEPEQIAETLPLDISIDADLEGGLMNWLRGSVGLPRDVLISVTIRNTSAEATPLVQLQLAIGRHSDRVDQDVTVDVEPLAGGATQTINRTISTDAPVFIGRYSVYGNLAAGDDTITLDPEQFTTSVENWPVLAWCLLVFAIAWLAFRSASRPRPARAAALATVTITVVAAAAQLLSS